MGNQIILALPVAFVFLAALFVIGQGVNRWLRIFEMQVGNVWLNTVGSVIVGLLVTSSLYALAHTHGKSILLGSVLLVVLYRLIYNKQNSGGNYTMPLKDVLQPRLWLMLLLSVTGTYALIVWQHLPALKTGYPLSYFDYEYYGVVSKAIGISGVENPSTNFINFMPFSGTLLYHYFDLWAADFGARLAHMNHFIFIMLVFYPALLGIVITGLFGIAKNINPNVKGWHVAFIVLAITGANLYLAQYKHIPLLNNYALKGFVGLFYNHKLFIIYAILIVSFSQLLVGNKALSAMWLLQLCMAYSTTIPGISGGLFLLLCLMVVLRKLTIKQATGFFAMLFFAAGYCVVFDKLFAEKPRRVVNLHELLSIKSFVIICAEYVIKLLIVFVPAMLLLAIRWLKKIKLDSYEQWGWLLAICASACTIPFVVLNHKLSNISQALYNFVPPIMVVLTAVSVIKVFMAEIPLAFKALPAALLLASCTYNFALDHKETYEYLVSENVYSKEYIEQCLHEVNSNNNDVQLVNVVIIGDDSITQWYYHFYQKATFLFYSEKVMCALDLSPFMQPERRNTVYFNNPDNYNNPIEKWFQKNHPGEAVFNDATLLEFLKANHVRYIVLSGQYKLTNVILEHLTLVSRNTDTEELFYKISF